MIYANIKKTIGPTKIPDMQPIKILEIAILLKNIAIVGKIASITNIVTAITLLNFFGLSIIPIVPANVSITPALSSKNGLYIKRINNDKLKFVHTSFFL